MVLSFVISFFNANVRDVNRCLDSIYNSIPDGIGISDFEVVCVNDASTESEGVAAVSGYLHNGIHPDNLILLHNKENKRIGGGRNTAMQVAKGRYIQNLDIDDFMAEGAFKHIVDCINRYDGVDVLRFDVHTADEAGNITKKGKSDVTFPQKIFTGRDYVMTHELPHAVWQYLYRRDYLSEQKLSYVENRYFEDTDYSMMAVACAKEMVDIPFATIVHTINSYQITNIGNSEVKICDLYYLYYRIGCIVSRIYANDIDLGNSLLAIYIKNYTYIILESYLWRLPYLKIRDLLVRYPLPDGVRLPWLMAMIRRYPRGSAVMIAAVSPAIRLVYKIYRLFK